MPLVKKTLAQLQLAPRECSPVPDIWGFPVHSGAFQRASAVAHEEPQIRTRSKALHLLNLKLSLILNYKIHKNSLRFAHVIIWVFMLLDLFLHTHTHMSEPLYNFVMTLFFPKTLFLQHYFKIYSMFFPWTICLGDPSVAKIIDLSLSF